MIKLGSRVKDSISGFSGIATGRFEYLYGCVRIGISPETLHDGKPVEYQVFDEAQCIVLDVAPGKAATAPVDARPAGPRSDPAPRSSPKR